MTDAGWETLSNQAVAAAGVVYFLALLAHLAEWSALRQVPASVLVGAAAGPDRWSRRSRGDSRWSRRSGADSRWSGRSGGDPRWSRRSRSDRHETTPSPPHSAAFLARLGLLLTGIATAVHLVSLVARGMAADPNRVPWGNMYEFTLAGSFVVSLLYLVLHRRFALSWMAPIVVGFVLTTLMVAVIWLHAPVAPLAEALYSPWLVIHVVAAVVATAAFTLGGIVSALYLVKDRRPDAGGYLGRLPSLPSLDRLSYRLHAFAFPVWSFAVLITGPIWAHQAWSRYWNWDPKEVWAFITWVVYAAYLHSRATAGWKGRTAAYLALIGLATLWFNFIGINYFSQTSQHSYALTP